MSVSINKTQRDRRKTEIHKANNLKSAKAKLIRPRCFFITRKPMLYVESE